MKDYRGERILSRLRGSLNSGPTSHGLRPWLVHSFAAPRLFLLEVDPHLHLERPVASFPAKLAERCGAVDVQVGALGRTEKAADRADRLGMVEDVGGVHAYLEADAFSDLKPLRDRHVRGPRARTREVVLSKVPPLSRKRIPENDVACLAIADGSQSSFTGCSQRWRDYGGIRTLRIADGHVSVAEHVTCQVAFLPNSFRRVDVKRPDDIRRAGANDHVLGGDAIRETGKEIKDPAHLPAFGDAAQSSCRVAQQWLTGSDRQSECSVSSELVFAVPARQRIVFGSVPWGSVSVWPTLQVLAPGIGCLKVHAECRPQCRLPLERVVVAVAQIRPEHCVPELWIRMDEVVIHVDT